MSNFNIRTLQMEPMKQYEIPENIQTSTGTFLDVDQARNTEETYIEAFTSMIYMEEYENSEDSRKFSIQDAYIEQHADKIFKTKVRYIQIFIVHI